MNVPTIIPFKHLDMFRFWCQKVLPTVYDDSLSYYELLGKVVKYLNDTMEDVNIGAQNIQQLYDNINDLVDEESIKEAVDDKIAEMYSEGYFSDIANNYGLLGKVNIFFGDSITYGSTHDETNPRVESPFPEYIGMITGSACYNYAVAGATMASITGLDNDFIHQLMACSQLERADNVFIMFGTNDRAHNTPVGWNENEESECYYGALKNGYEYIRSRNNHCQIYVMSPTYSTIASRKLTTDYKSTIYSYADACKSFCNLYGAKYIDLLEHGYVNEANYLQYTFNGILLNDDGHKLVAQDILYKLGGSPSELAKGFSVFDDAQYDLPMVNEYYDYNVYDGYGTDGINTFGNWSNVPNDFTIELDYLCVPVNNVVHTYDMSVGEIGIEIRYDNVLMAKCVGLKLGSNGHIRLNCHCNEFNVNAEAPISLKLVNTSGVELDQCLIRNICIYTPNSRGKILNLNWYTINIDNEYYNGNIKVLRAKNTVTCNIHVLSKKEVPANTNIAVSQAFKHYKNEPVNYFPVMLGTNTPSRAQITANGSLQVASIVPANTSVYNTITI